MKLRLGVRLQIVLALLALFALAFVPLFVAVASLTRATLGDVRESSARALGRAVAAHVAEATARRGLDGLPALLDAQIGAGGVAAIGVYDEGGRALRRAGEPSAVAALPATVPARAERATSVRTEHGAAIQVIVPGPSGTVATVLRTDDDAGRAAPLVRLVGLYTVLVALALLVFAYIALGRLIVQPLDALGAAARRVAGGARTLDAPRSGPAELVDLGASLSEMTAKLRADERRMRDQIAELERRAEELRQAQDRLVRSERLASVGRLSAGLAHEIGNPIAALMGLEDLLLAGGLDPAEQRDFLERIRNETERIHRILRDLLDFARPAAARSDADDAKPGDVAEALADVAALVRPQKSFRDVALATDVPPGPLRVTLARERIMQVLLNLLLNAADATDGKGHVRVAVERDGERIRISVEDDGPGVDPAIAARLFEPFATTKEIGKGTGLGLAVCRGLVEAAGGAIAFDAEHAAGARFVVELPAAVD